MCSERETDYRLMARQVEELVGGKTFWVGALANVSALLFSEMHDINWVGFYLRESLVVSGGGDRLVLGPFQGRVACERIAFGKGVCGTAAAANRVVRVEDVHAFAGHIACDSASNSEIVLPLHVAGTVVGVLDIDSPVVARFTEQDEQGLRLVVHALEFSGVLSDVVTPSCPGL